MALNLKDVLKAARATDLILTPRIMQWLMQYGDDAVPPHIADWIAEQLKAKPRVRSGSFSASSAGRCLRQQELAYLDMPSGETIDYRLQNIFNDGKWRHLRWQAMCLDANVLQKAEMPLYWRGKKSRGTIDGYGVVPDNHVRPSWRGKDFGFELKGMNPYGYARAVKRDPEMKEEHLRQVHRYFLMGGFDLFVIVYEDKASQGWFEWVIEPDDQRLKESQQELDELNEAIDLQLLHPVLPQCKIRTGEFKECPYGIDAHGACLKSGDWPNLTNPKNRKNRKRK